MAAESKQALIKTAHEVDLVANNKVDKYDGGDGSTAFVVATGDVGDDIINNFDYDDTLITNKKIFDGNNDGIISFGKNGMLDVDRVSSKKAGNDQLSLNGSDHKVTELRYLGEMDGQHAYARSSTLDIFNILFDSNDESKIGNDKFDGEHVILFDNRLGLNLGNDTVKSLKGLGIVTTSALSDPNGDGFIKGMNSTLNDGTHVTTFDITAGGASDVNCGSITVLADSGGTLHLWETYFVDGLQYFLYEYLTS